MNPFLKTSLMIISKHVLFGFFFFLEERRILHTSLLAVGGGGWPNIGQGICILHTSLVIREGTK